MVIRSTRTNETMYYANTYNVSAPINTTVTETFRIANSGTGPLFLGEQTYNYPLVEIIDYSSPMCIMVCPSWSNQFTVSQQPSSYKISENGAVDFKIQFRASQRGSYTIAIQLYTTYPSRGSFWYLSRY